MQEESELYLVAVLVEKVYVIVEDVYVEIDLDEIFHALGRDFYGLFETLRHPLTVLQLFGRVGYLKTSSLRDKGLDVPLNTKTNAPPSRLA